MWHPSRLLSPRVDRLLILPFRAVSRFGAFQAYPDGSFPSERFPELDCKKRSGIISDSLLPSATYNPTSPLNVRMLSMTFDDFFQHHSGDS